MASFAPIRWITDLYIQIMRGTPLILQLIFATEEYLLIIGMICCYLVFALFYVIIYAITSKSYYGIVSGKEKR